MKTINAALAKSGHDDVIFDYIRVQSKVVITVPADKILRLTKDSPSLLLGLGEIRGDVVYDVGDQKAATAKILPFAVDSECWKACCFIVQRFDLSCGRVRRQR